MLKLEQVPRAIRRGEKPPKPDEKDKRFEYKDTPFGSAIQALHKLDNFMKDFEIDKEGNRKLTFSTRFIEEYDRLRETCNRLQNDGLPRSVLRTAKKKYAEVAYLELKKQMEIIESTDIYPDIWEGYGD